MLKPGILLLVALGTWWLTGIDKTAAGESKRDAHLFRALRCLAVLFLTALMFYSDFGAAGAPILIVGPVGIAIVLRSSLSELFAGGFLRLVDPNLHDTREFDPKKSRRFQDAIAHLIQTGRRDEAIKLCEELKQSGEVDRVTLEHTLEYLGVKQERAPTAGPLREAGRFRAQGQFAEAEKLLTALLKENPANADAAMLLMRLHAENLRQPTGAHEVLRALAIQPHISADHLEFARRSIDEWSHPKPITPELTEPPKVESIDELLARGGLGSAIEMLEAQLKARPTDYDLQMKLAEVYAEHCKNAHRAGKIIQQLERTPGYSQEQIATARAKLLAWQAAAVARTAGGR